MGSLYYKVSVQLGCALSTPIVSLSLDPRYGGEAGFIADIHQSPA
jgi:hypothetical protein